MKKGFVSIVIPTRNSGIFLENTLRSIRDQSYPHIETIIVDGKSTDSTLTLAKKYRCTTYTYVPEVKSGIFDAPHKRNYGMARGKGAYVYWLDADMELPKDLIREAVTWTQKGYAAVVLPEDSFGEGIWAKAKQLERRCYWGDSSVESPRFFTKKAWDDIGGFDLSLGAGGDDIDLTQKMLEKGYRIGRTHNIVRHNEGKLSVITLFKKRFMYGREMRNYLKKRPKSWWVSYNPMKPSYFRNWRLFVANPHDAILFVIMRSIEYAGGGSGLIFSLFENLIPGNDKSKSTKRDYSDYSSQYYGATVAPLLQKYLNIAPYRSLADIGCGDGSLLFALKKQGYLEGKTTYAVDLSPKSIRLIRKIDPHIRAAVDDAEKIRTIKSNTVDFCISTMVIEHVDDRRLLQSIDRILRKKGMVYITTVFKKPYGWYFYRREGRWVMDVTHLREYTRDKDLIGLIDPNKYSILETKKSLIWFPVVDFFVRRSGVSNRKIFTDNIIFRSLRLLKLPIIGYYEWEIMFQKR